MVYINMVAGSTKTTVIYGLYCKQYIQYESELKS